MKTKAQNWKYEPQKWTQVLDYFISSDGKLFVGNYKQRGVFHYVEDEFLDNVILGDL